MKKAIIISMLLLALFLSSCGNDATTQIEELSSATGSTTSYISLPKPEEIILMDDPAGRLDVDFEPKYRVVYEEGIPGVIANLADKSSFPSHSYDNSEGEMEMASFLKHYEINKQDFIRGIQLMYEIYLERGWDIIEEPYELPNPDIIYTFDNEVINAYYRRENPVAPDWSKVKTYESYAEYRKAKG